jgi:3-oxoacyl-[acyl-carrier protein] reductase
MFDLTNKVALITGASRGIGRAIALCFARQGAHVIVNYAHNEVEAHKTLELMDNKKDALALKFDVSDEKEVDDNIDLIKKKYGKIDILVNNAGISIDGLLMRLKMSDFEKQMNINLKGTFIVSKACIKHMIKNRWGRIINISSVVGEMGNAGQCAYAASKAGLIGFTKSLAQELCTRKI